MKDTMWGNGTIDSPTPRTTNAPNHFHNLETAAAPIVKKQPSP
eukprot:gene12376-20503_t